MKLLFENWRKYLKEEQGVTYFWQTRGPWKGESQVEFGVTSVPKATPRPQERLEEIFEEVRKSKFPNRPSRLNCVYICENVEGFKGKSFCSYPASGGGETFKVELRGNYNIFKTDSEFWTEAVIAHDRYKDEGSVRSWAEAYWEGSKSPSFSELLVSPPESVIIVGKYEEESKQDLHDFKKKAGDYLEDAMGDWFYDEPYGWDDIDPDELSREEFMKGMKAFFDKMHKDITPLLKGVKTSSKASSNEDEELPGI